MDGTLAVASLIVRKTVPIWHSAQTEAVII